MTLTEKTYNELSYSIIECCYTVHSELGPGLMESIYEACLVKELRDSGFNVKQQFPLPVIYKNVQLSKTFRVDLIVNDCILIELKSVEYVMPVHKAQLVSYLKLANMKLGLLINFNEASLKNGIVRKLNGVL